MPHEDGYKHELGPKPEQVHVDKLGRPCKSHGSVQHFDI